MGKKKSLSNIALGTIVTTTAIGTIPTLGQPAAENLKSKFAEGAGNVGKTFPTLGKIRGAGLVIRATKKLSGSTKKLKLKGGKI